MISGQAQSLHKFPIAASDGTAVVMNDADFSRWVRLLEQKTGVVVPPSRRQFLETNLRLRLAELKLTRLDQYFEDRLTGPSGAREWAVLVDRLTVHETRFFRHPPSLALLRENILPSFVARSQGQQEFHAWSVGCSTGEESYSLSMIIDEYARRATHPFRYAVTGSDVSSPSLKVAEAATYAVDRCHEIPEIYRAYCRHQGSAPVGSATKGDEEFVIADDLRQRTRFAQLNMMDISRQPMSGLELIFCQNVLIYFPRQRREAFLDRLVQCLRPGGCLIIGPGEVTRWRNSQVVRIEDKRALAFRRLDASDCAAKDSSS
ncbi:MAG: protein-glutamate O-methyltransferase CheR [Lysobacterales bacterium]